MIVELDVGGITYPTTQDTLVKCDYFRRMFDGTMTQGLKRDGRFFIDRDGGYFTYVLDYLRSGYIPEPEGLTQVTIAKANLEFDFFGLPRINPRKRKRDKDELKPFWYDFLLGRIRKKMLEEGTESFDIFFEMRTPKQKFVAEELRSRQRRDAIAKIIKNDLNREEDEIWSKMNDKEWLLQQIKQYNPEYTPYTPDKITAENPLQDIREIREDWQIILEERIRCHSKEDKSIDLRWTNDEKLARLEHIVLEHIVLTDPCQYTDPVTRNSNLKKMTVILVNKSF